MMIKLHMLQRITVSIDCDERLKDNRPRYMNTIWMSRRCESIAARSSSALNRGSGASQCLVSPFVSSHLPRVRLPPFYRPLLAQAASEPRPTGDDYVKENRNIHPKHLPQRLSRGANSNRGVASDRDMRDRSCGL